MSSDQWKRRRGIIPRHMLTMLLVLLLVRAFLLAARILFWFSMNKFVHRLLGAFHWSDTHLRYITQGGVQRHLLNSLMEILTQQTPTQLCFDWQRHASLDVLLWILFATYMSFVRVRITPWDSKEGQVVRRSLCEPSNEILADSLVPLLHRMATSNNEAHSQATTTQFLQRV